MPWPNQITFLHISQQLPMTSLPSWSLRKSFYFQRRIFHFAGNWNDRLRFPFTSKLFRPERSSETFIGIGLSQTRVFCVSNSAVVTQIGIDADEERNMSRQSRLAGVFAYPANDNFMIEFATKADSSGKAFSSNEIFFFIRCYETQFHLSCIIKALNLLSFH